MTRFSLRSWKSRSLAAILALAVTAPVAATPALADGWQHGRGDSRRDEWRGDRDDYRDAWGRPIFVRPAPVYVAPVYAPPPGYYYAPAPEPIYAPPPPPPPMAYYAPAPRLVPARAYACSNGAVAGGLIGAATGGLIGSQFGRSSGNVAATVIGILGGAAIGSSVGQSAAGCP
jgi:hypothetical protein